MPEPLLYLKATGLAATVSAIFVLAVTGIRRDSASWLNAICVVAIGLGLAAGYYVLSLQIAWPPRNGLDRLLTVIIPAVIGIELLAGLPRFSSTVAWVLRLILAASILRILLHGSVYLSDWTFWQSAAAWGVSGVLLASCWSLLCWLSQRSGGVSITFALCLAIQCASMTVMMAGYIKGGVAALPLVATLAATSIAAWLFTKRLGTSTNFNSVAMIGIGVVGLFGVLLIGRFFGRVSTGFAVTMLFAPLLCWTTELPRLRHQKPWVVGSLRLALVATPLVIVLVIAKRDFDRDMSPLMLNANGPTVERQCHE